jgi:hypothetical protein
VDLATLRFRAGGAFAALAVAEPRQRSAVPTVVILSQRASGVRPLVGTYALIIVPFLVCPPWACR